MWQVHLIQYVIFFTIITHNTSGVVYYLQSPTANSEASSLLSKSQRCSCTHSSYSEPRLMSKFHHSCCARVIQPRWENASSISAEFNGWLLPEASVEWMRSETISSTSHAVPGIAGSSDENIGWTFLHGSIWLRQIEDRSVLCQGLRLDRPIRWQNLGKNRQLFHSIGSSSSYFRNFDLRWSEVSAKQFIIIKTAILPHKTCRNVIYTMVNIGYSS